MKAEKDREISAFKNILSEDRVEQELARFLGRVAIQRPDLSNEMMILMENLEEKRKIRLERKAGIDEEFKRGIRFDNYDLSKEGASLPQ